MDYSICNLIKKAQCLLSRFAVRLVGAYPVWVYILVMSPHSWG